MSAWNDKLRSKAADPETSPQLLDHWAAHRELRPMLATNPNTPLTTLFSLIQDCPREFLANPVLPLLYLSDPSLFTQMDSDDALCLLMYEEIPAWLLTIFTQHHQASVRDTALHHVGYGDESATDDQAAIVAIQQAPIHRDNLVRLPALPCDGWLIPVLAEHQKINTAIAQFRGTPPELLACLAESKWSNLRQDALANRQTPPDVFARLAEHPDARIRAQIATCQRTPRDVLERLMSDPDVSVRSALAGRPYLPSDWLSRLALDPDAAVRRAVLLHANVTDETLVRLIGDADFQVCDGALKHPRFPVASIVPMLDTLATSQMNKLRLMVARHAETSPELLLRLAHDPQLNIRRAVAANPHVPVAALEELAGDADKEVRRLVAKHPATSAATLERMAADDDLKVILAVATHPHSPASTLAAWSTGKGSQIRYYVAGNPATPTDALSRLARDVEGAVRQQVAINPNTPAEVVVAMLDDSQEIVRHRAARHPHLPTEILLRLAVENDLSMRRAIAANPAATPSALAQLADSSDMRTRYLVAGNPATPAPLLHLLARDAEVEVRKQMARHPHTPIEDLEQLAGETDLTQYCLDNPHLPPTAFARLAAHPDETVRGCVAAHPHAPATVLAALAQDAAAPVREAAAGHPAIPSQALAQLADDPEPKVLAALAGNLHTLPETLDHVFSHLPARVFGQYWQVLSGLAQNPHTPSSVLARMMKRANRSIRDMVSHNPNMPVALLDQLLAPHEPDAEPSPRSKEVMKRQIIRSLTLRHGYYNMSLNSLLALSYSFIPAPVLAKRAEAFSWIERYVVARHPNTDRATLERLAGDANRFVRAHARSRLATV